MWSEIAIIAGLFMTISSLFALQNKRIEKKVPENVCKEIHISIRNQLNKVDRNFQEIYNKLDEQTKLLTTLDTKISLMNK